MVEVFKTDVQEVAQSKKLVQTLLHYFPNSRINFDLQDCDRILRVEEETVCPEKIMAVLHANGYRCEVLL